VGVDRGFPKAETFLWRRIMGEKFPSRGSALDANHLRHNNCQRPYCWWSSNASTPTEPTGRCF